MPRTGKQQTAQEAALLALGSFLLRSTQRRTLLTIILDFSGGEKLAVVVEINGEDLSLETLCQICKQTAGRGGKSNVNIEPKPASSSRGCGWRF